MDQVLDLLFAKITAANSIEKVIQTITIRLARLVSCESATFSVLNGNSRVSICNWLDPAASKERTEFYSRARSSAMGDALVKKLSSLEPYWCPDVRAEFDQVEHFDLSNSVQGLWLPFHNKGRMFAILELIGPSMNVDLDAIGSKFATFANRVSETLEHREDQLRLIGVTKRT